MEISLERQFFYTPPAAAGPKLVSRSSGLGEGPLYNDLWGSVTPATTAVYARSLKRLH